MAVPTTKATFKSYCLRSLGFGVIDINVSDDQADDRIDEALQYFAQYHYNGIERTYLKHLITSAEVTRARSDSSATAVAIVDKPTGPPLNFFTIDSIILLSISSKPFLSIFKASKLQNLSSIQRDNIKKELFFLEKELIDAEKKDLKLEIRQINHSKFLLQQVDESINFNELIHKPTRVMGYPATQNVIGSSLGIILTGFVLAVEGFSGSNITYDINGWFNY